MAIQYIDQRRRIGIRQQSCVLSVQYTVRVEVLAARDARVAQPGQRASERAAVGGKLRVEVRVARRLKREALFFPIDDEPDGDALNTARAQPGLNLLPQHRRERVAVEPIETAAALLRADQVVVAVVSVLDGLVERFRGGFVKGAR